MGRIVDIWDLRQRARRRLPQFLFGYVEGGGYAEETLRRNRTDIESLCLVPRSLNDVSQRSISKKILGVDATMPIVLAPIGALGFTHPNGEVAAAKAAQKLGIPFCLSTLSIGTIEDVAEATGAPFWFQLYMCRDRNISVGLLEKAKAAKCSTLVLTVDSHVRSQRHREQKGGLVAPLMPTFPMAVDSIGHSSWLFPMLRSRRRTFGNLVGLIPNAHNVPRMSEYIAAELDPTIGLKHIEWLRSVWPGKLVVKGLMHPDDAGDAIAAGADGIVISNHGGRQADGVVSTASMVGPTIDAVRGRGEVLVDGGIRSGIDTFKMLALGANACLIGRAYVYGLAAGGQVGVERAIQILGIELDQTMGLCGVADINRLPQDLLFRRA